MSLYYCLLLLLWTSFLKLLLLHPVSFDTICVSIFICLKIFFIPLLNFFFFFFTNWLFCSDFFFNSHIWKISNFPPVGSSGKESAYQLRKCRDTGWIPGLLRSLGIGNGNPLQFAWKRSLTEEPGRLQSMGLQRVRHNWVTEYIHTDVFTSHTIVAIKDTWYDFNLHKFCKTCFVA